MSTLIRIYTDGSWDPNTRDGGWAAILVNGDDLRALSGYCAQTTNNRMELEAIIRALRALSGPSRVVLTTDSMYVIKGFTRWLAGWQKRRWRTTHGTPVINKDLWLDLIDAADRHTIEWQHVKGHNGNLYNELADALASRARQESHV